jgi:hypothetical protein
MLPVNPLDISGQDLPAPKLEIPLYEGAAPGSEDWDWTENTATTASGLPMVQNVVNPVLLYYPPHPCSSPPRLMTRSFHSVVPHIH